MQINPEVIEIIKSHKIDKSQGLLCLLGIYYNLDIESTCSEETIEAINLTKIVEKDYKNNTLQWNVPLFEGQQTEWDWVKSWNEKWNVNRSRKASNPDVLKRMQDFFKKYPSYRVQDVMRATDMYFASTTNPLFPSSNSAAFIFDGAGAMKKSILLSWCEKLSPSETINHQRGKVVQ